MLKTALVKALKATFDEQYPEVDFRSIKASVEYPVLESDYPGVWVNYSDTEPVKAAGVSHVEWAADLSKNPELYAQYTRHLFQGTASFTVVALKSLECDRLYDQMIRVISMGYENEFTSRFRSALESNPYIAIDAVYDSLQPGGDAAVPGTPWGTDEVIYERTINMTLMGEFYIEPTSATLVKLREITVDAHPYFTDEELINPSGI